MSDHTSIEPDFDRLLQLLEQVEAYAEAAFIELDYQATLHIPNTTQLQFEIVNNVVEALFRHIPELHGSGMSERLKSLVRMAFKEITGWHRQLDDDIKSAVKRVKEKSGGNEF